MAAASYAVIGSGVAGLIAAHELSRRGQVTLYEADTRVGGHADTHDVDGLAIDTGFIVHNQRTYPTLLRVFDELGVPTQDSEMSMSVRDEASGLEYAGALGARGLFPTWHNLGKPRFLRMLAEITRFHRRARALLAAPEGEAPSDQTLASFLEEGGFTPYFRRHFMTPLVACVWSCDPAVASDYPARYLFAFLEHHGMLSVFGSPTWRTVTGGSRTYVERIVAGLHEVRTGTKVTDLAETPAGVRVTDGNGETRTYDAVVVATHPDQALSLLSEPTSLQRAVLGAIPYSANVAQLHTDTRLLPRAERARASWNDQARAARTGDVLVSYDLTRLMRLPTDIHYLVTLNGTDVVDPETVIATREYAHPIYTPASVAAQRRLPEIETPRVAFAGAYHGWGFHEDGALSGLRAAQRLAGRAPAPALPATPMRYDTTVRHTRTAPLKNAFRYRSEAWLVDLDALPRGFEARDHVGDPAGTLRGNIDAILAEHGVDLAGGRVLMLAHRRQLGYVFNPISVHWCFDRDDQVAAVVVEVHNTYGGRHAYVVHPDEHGRAEVEKRLYVSPFNDVSGRYSVVVPVPGRRAHVAVTLHREGQPPFVATLSGTRAGARRLPSLAPQLAMARIRLQGIKLWLRRLPVQPRPEPRQEANHG